MGISYSLKISYIIKLYLLTLLVILLNNLAFDNNYKTNGNISPNSSSFLGLENYSQNNSILPQSFLNLSLSSNTPGKKSRKKGSTKSKSKSSNGDSSNQAVESLANMFEQMTISSGGLYIFEVVCLDLLTLAESYGPLLVSLAELHSSVGNFNPLTSCLEQLDLRRVNAEVVPQALLDAIGQVSKFLESQKRLESKLAKMLAKYVSLEELIRSLIEKCILSTSQTLTMGSLRYKSLFGLSEKVNKMDNKVKSFILQSGEAYSKFCNEQFFSEMEVAISGSQYSHTEESMDTK
ncbi:uncharacterized protein cubi_01527 [Cryptosporidium ubiquitum]|uniref:Uncharacterized protein n=1 Tax=Cryptosporidium ubiquitum TaxID=857276 RepID=A0A1J4MD74_9CRYT|nr:uncharacterized protein cubi_01527 [Cryptosporidium ubiquitum]OII72194.1 hypothetical protein cubi_01527 [Cryptosporidium ubiquitum]